VSLEFAIHDGLRLSIGRAAGAAAANGAYPTARLQRGLLLEEEGRDLAGEGVGFGVPVAKRGLRALFPGGVRLSRRRVAGHWEVTAVYDLCLAERFARAGGGGLRTRAPDAAREVAAALHRREPALREPLTAASSAARRLMGWSTSYEPAGVHVPVEVRYSIAVPGSGAGGGGADDGRDGGAHAGSHADTRILVSVSPGALPADVSELAVMNELGARPFDLYVDAAGGALRGARIGAWDPVEAPRAAFVDTEGGAVFSLGQVGGAELRRGRELVGKRLAWAGFGYVLPPTTRRFTYDLRVGRLS
jgi:hypothetical protein